MINFYSYIPFFTHTMTESVSAGKVKKNVAENYEGIKEHILLLIERIESNPEYIERRNKWRGWGLNQAIKTK